MMTRVGGVYLYSVTARTNHRELSSAKQHISITSQSHGSGRVHQASTKVSCRAWIVFQAHYRLALQAVCNMQFVFSRPAGADLSDFHHQLEETAFTGSYDKIKSTMIILYFLLQLMFLNSSLPQPIWVAMTNYHRLGGLINKHLFLTVLKARAGCQHCQILVRNFLQTAD